MSRQVQIRRGTTAENNAFTGAEGEITFDTTTHELRVHDGTTTGGHKIPTTVSLATVARTGSYNDLTNKPILSTVATSGSYNDLSNKPTIPAAQVNSDWNAISGKAQILNKPTIPTVPTNVSEFTNDANYQTNTQVSSAIGTHNSSNSAHSDIRTDISNLKDLSNITTDGTKAIAHNAMPSGRSVNLTLGASGSTYTAPGEGYFYVAYYGNDNGFIRMQSDKIASSINNASGQYIQSGCFLPVAKDAVMSVWYTNLSSVTAFRFIYANGEQ